MKVFKACQNIDKYLTLEHPTTKNNKPSLCLSHPTKLA